MFYALCASLKANHFDRTFLTTVHSKKTSLCIVSQRRVRFSWSEQTIQADIYET